MHTNFLIIATLAVFLVGCGSTQQIAISTTEPAPVSFNHDIARIGVINASEQQVKAAYDRGIERLVGAEDDWLNEKGRDAALVGLIEELKKDQRFETVSLLDSVPKALRVFSFDNESVAWTKIETLCETYGLDAIFALAHYHTETQVSLKKTKMLQPDMMRVKVEVPAQEITLETLIENGWRIYYPEKREILDEFTFNEEIVSTAKGVNPVEALRAIDNRKDSIVLRGRRSGSSYGLRLQPFQRAIYRDYFVKGSERFEMAKDMVVAGDIIGASKLWHLEVDNLKSKIKGRACFNLAVGHEVQGALEKALEWAVKAHDNLQNKSSETYVKELERRIEQLEVLNSQLVDTTFSE